MWNKKISRLLQGILLFVKHHAVLSTFLINASILFFGVLTGPHFQTNDDPGMIYAFSGTFIFDEPTAVTAFTSKLWGLVNIGLYKWFNGVGIEMYTVLLLIVIFISFGVFIWVLLTRVYLTYLNLGAVVLFAYFAALPFYHELQFTMAAAIAMFSGYILINHAIEQKWYIYIVGFFLIFLGLLIRPTAFFVLMPVIVCMHILYLCIQKKWERTVIQNIGLIVVGTIGLTGVDKLISTKFERNFVEFNTFRGSINDFGMVVSHSEVSLRNEYIKSIGANGLRLYEHNFYSDRKLYNPSIDYGQLNKAIAISDIFDLTRLKRNFTDTQKLGIELIQNRFYLGVLLLPFVLGLFAIRIKYIVGSLSFLALSIAFSILIGLLFKAPDFRISFPILIAAVLYTKILFFDLNRNSSTRTAGLGMMALVTMASFYVVRVYFPLRNWKYANLNLPNASGKFYLVQHSVLPFDGMDPFRISKTGRRLHAQATGSFSILPQAHGNMVRGKFVYVSEKLRTEPENVRIVVYNSTRERSILADIKHYMLLNSDTKLEFVLIAKSNADYWEEYGCRKE